MIVQHIRNDGSTRKVYNDIAQYTSDKSVVVLNRYIPAENPPIVGDTSSTYFKNWGQYHCVAIINLAPGECWVWSEDAERN